MDGPHTTIALEAGKHRGLMAVVVVLGVLILLAFGILVGGLLLGRGPGAEARLNGPYDVNLGLAQEARLAGATLVGNRLLIQTQDAQGRDTVIVVDATTGRTIGRISLSP